jgi:hypothetical protein
MTAEYAFEDLQTVDLWNPPQINLTRKPWLSKWSYDSGTAVLTVKVELPRNILKLRNSPKMGRQLLDVSSIEALTCFNELEIMFLKLSFLYWFLFLSVLLAELDGVRGVRWVYSIVILEVRDTHTREQFAKPGVDLEMCIPKTTFHVNGASGFEVLEDGILASFAKSVITEQGSEQCA